MPGPIVAEMRDGRRTLTDNPTQRPKAPMPDSLEALIAGSRRQRSDYAPVEDSTPMVNATMRDAKRVMGTYDPLARMAVDEGRDPHSNELRPDLIKQLMPGQEESELEYMSHPSNVVMGALDSGAVAGSMLPSPLMPVANAYLAARGLGNFAADPSLENAAWAGAGLLPYAGRKGVGALLSKGAKEPYPRDFHGPRRGVEMPYKPPPGAPGTGMPPRANDIGMGKPVSLQGLEDADQTWIQREVEKRIAPHRSRPGSTLDVPNNPVAQRLETERRAAYSQPQADGRRVTDNPVRPKDDFVHDASSGAGFDLPEISESELAAMQKRWARLGVR